MPTFTASTPTADHKFNGQTIAVPYVFADGDTLSALEALAFNRFIATAVGNAFGAEVRRDLEALDTDRVASHKVKTYTGPMDESGKKPAKATIDDILSPDDAQAAFDAKFSAYVLGAGRQSTSTGPKGSTLLAKFVSNLATTAIKNKIVAKGWKVRDFQTAKVTVDGKEVSNFNHLVAQYIENHRDDLEAQAQAQIDALSTASDDLDLDLKPPSAALSDAA